MTRKFKFSMPGRLVAGTLLAAVLGTATLSALAHGGMGGGMGMMGGGPGMGMMHGGGPGMGGMGMMGRGIEHMLDGVNASAEQRAQIQKIAEAARTDMQAQREAGRALRERAMQAFTQPNVDANAVEQLRQQMLAQHDQASRRMSQAMLDISRVLTPEQRKALAERMTQRRAMAERHRHERQQLDGGSRR